MAFLFFYWVELTFGNENLVGTRKLIKFLVYIYIYKRNLPTDFYIQLRRSVYITYIMFQSGHLTFERFEHFVCHRYIWYFHLSVQLFIVGNKINLSIHEHI